MKRIYLAIIILLTVNPLLIQTQELSQEHTRETEVDFDKRINFDELEDEMIKMNIMDSIKPIPPHPIIVWVRIIGCPIANAYFAVRRVVRNSIKKVAAFLKLKSEVTMHEELLIK